MECINHYFSLIDEKTKDIEFLKSWEKKTNMRRCHLVLCMLGAAVVLGYLLLGLPFISNMIGFVYPAYFSLVALNSKDREDDTKWLTYWVVFGFFSIIESIVSIFAKLNVMYYIVKIVMLVCCFIPDIDLANVLYRDCVSPFLSKHEDKIDSTINKVTETIEKKVKEVVSTK
ncbi:hypothetical protein WA171_007000 [Blastocystis sp. BT1]